MKTKSRQNLRPRLDESLIADLPPFAKLSREAISDILKQATSRRHDAGTAIFEEGREADRFYMLLDGYIRVVRITPDGEQVIAHHIPAGQLFGIAVALGRDTYPATAMTATESLSLSWPSSLWNEFVDTHIGFGAQAMKTVGGRMGEINNRMVEMATQQVEQRIANAVLRLINQTGHKVDSGIEINFPITRQDLSEMTGTTLHTVSRVLSSWEKLGYIKSGRKRIVVTDPHQLVMLCAGKN